MNKGGTHKSYKDVILICELSVSKYTIFLVIEFIITCHKKLYIFFKFLLINAIFVSDYFYLIIF